MSPAGAWVVPAPVAQSTRFKILGPIEVFDGDGPLPLGGPRQVALLALLLVHANQAVASDAAIEALWGGDGPAPSIKRLQMAVTRLRKALEPLGGSGRELPLRTVAGGYVLSVAPGELDANVFEEGVVQGTGALARGDAALAAELLRQADARWRGPALADVAYEAFAQAEIRRLDELRLTALEARTDADLRLGRHADVIGELEALLAHHPTRERLAGQLMLALYRSGRQSDALDVYQRSRVYLSNELGLEPGPALRQLQRSILAQDATLSLPPEVPADGDGGVSADDRLQPAPAAEQTTGTPARPVVASRDGHRARSRSGLRGGSGALTAAVRGRAPGRRRDRHTPRRDVLVRPRRRRARRLRNPERSRGRRAARPARGRRAPCGARR
jgi:DNA-binding SARP family transcriptional activator